MLEDEIAARRRMVRLVVQGAFTLERMVYELRSLLEKMGCVPESDRLADAEKDICFVKMSLSKRELN